MSTLNRRQLFQVGGGAALGLTLNGLSKFWSEPIAPLPTFHPVQTLTAKELNQLVMAIRQLQGRVL